MSEFKWYFGSGEEPEHYTLAGTATREETIAEGTAYYDGETFSIIEGAKGTMKSFVPCVDRIIDMMIESADDDGAFGEDGFDDMRGTPEAIKAAEHDLEAVMREWFDRHAAIFPEPWSFARTRSEEVIVGEDPDANPALDAGIGFAPAVAS